MKKEVNIKQFLLEQDNILITHYMYDEMIKSVGNVA